MVRIKGMLLSSGRALLGLKPSRLFQSGGVSWRYQMLILVIYAASRSALDSGRTLRQLKLSRSFGHTVALLVLPCAEFVHPHGFTPCRKLRGCPGFDRYETGYRLQVERPSPDRAKNLTANNDSYGYALAA